MATLFEKKEALRKADQQYANCEPWQIIAREALRREIAREEAKKSAKLPTLFELREANGREDLSAENLTRIGNILAALENLAPHLKTQANVGGTYTVVSQGPFTDFANAIAAEVRLDP